MSIGKWGWALCGLLAIVLVAPFIPATANGLKQSDVEQLAKAMEDKGIAVTEVEMRTSVSLPAVINQNELRIVQDTWQKKLLGKTRIENRQEKGMDIYAGSMKAPAYVLDYQLIGVPQTGKIGVYIVVKLKGKRESLQDLVKAQERVNKVLKEERQNGQNSTCIRGMYNDTLSVDHQEEMVSSILQSLQAKEVERLVDESVVSISGLTGLWEPYIHAGERKMNLQVAAHLDQLNKVTRFTAGTPIITAEY